MSNFAWFMVAAMLLVATVGAGQELPAVVVEADRLPDAQSAAPLSVVEITKDELLTAPELRLDDILRSEVPGFSLFRRNSSRVANPTTQGVTLRNFGPSGAGRSLVLLDGIPLNDPFAGYVLWNQVPPSSIQTVLVVPGGGAGLFGNAAMAGTIFLVSDRGQNDEPLVAEVAAGSADTFAGWALSRTVQGPATISLFAEHFETGGYPVIEADQRGRVDRNADAESHLLRLDSEFALSKTTSLRLSGDLFFEERGNGTIYTENDTEGQDASAVLKSRFPSIDAELQLTGYYQGRKYRSTFSSINDARDVETPALDQYAVPANAAGGSAVWSMALGQQQRITVGSDLRWVEGETKELFRFIANEFTRRREAGGEQLFAGAFAEDIWTPTPPLTVVGSVRLDYWQLGDGFRHEFNAATGAPTLISNFADRDGLSVNGRLGSRVDLTRTLSVRAAGYTGFRVPTLNELYRPFRVGNDVTEANAGLKPEHLLGCEAGIDWKPTEKIRIGATGFFNRLEDAVGNITIGVGPGTFNPGGFIPAGGVLRQRQNIDLINAPGAELSAEWQPIDAVQFKASYIFTDPTIASASERALVGKLLAQTPQNVFVGAVQYRPAPKWDVTVQVRYCDRQFEDDQNSRVLAPFTTVDTAVLYEFSNHVTGALKIENLFDAEIESGKSATGLTSIGAPRLVTLLLRVRL